MWSASNVVFTIVMFAIGMFVGYCIKSMFVESEHAEDQNNDDGLRSELKDMTNFLNFLHGKINALESQNESLRRLFSKSSDRHMAIVRRVQVLEDFIKYQNDEAEDPQILALGKRMSILEEQVKGIHERIAELVGCRGPMVTYNNSEAGVPEDETEYRDAAITKFIVDGEESK